MYAVPTPFPVVHSVIELLRRLDWLHSSVSSVPYAGAETRKAAAWVGDMWLYPTAQMQAMHALAVPGQVTGPAFNDPC